MVTRACISINNRCNLNCTYCHFHEKKDCIDLPFSMPYDTPLNEVSFDVIDFDRSCCFKEVFTG